MQIEEKGGSRKFSRTGNTPGQELHTELKSSKIMLVLHLSMGGALTSACAHD